MLKRRIVPVQLLMGDRLVKTVEFDRYRDVGDPAASSRVYNSQYADELIFLNIDRAVRTIDPLLRFMDRVSEVTFMPLSVGGGIGSVNDAMRLIRSGADKVVVNSIAYHNPAVIRGIADEFGSQAVVASIDVRADPVTGEYALYSDCGRRKESIGLAAHIEFVREHGAGEILVNSIDRDGGMRGYDLRLLRAVMQTSGLPVIGCGGAGHYNHLKEAFIESGVAALACGSLFNFGDNNPIRAKAFLSNYGLAFKVV